MDKFPQSFYEKSLEIGDPVKTRNKDRFNVK